jgi:hypothetical protein
MAAYQRLRLLKKSGVITAFFAPGLPEQIYFLTTPGAKIVAAAMEKSFEDLSWYTYSKTPKDYYFLRHFLAINDFRILLTTACRESPLTLLGFIPGVSHLLHGLLSRL